MPVTCEADAECLAQPFVQLDGDELTAPRRKFSREQPASRSDLNHDILVRDRSLCNEARS